MGLLFAEWRVEVLQVAEVEQLAAPLVGPQQQPVLPRDEWPLGEREAAPARHPPALQTRTKQAARIHGHPHPFAQRRCVVGA